MRRARSSVVVVATLAAATVGACGSGGTPQDVGYSPPAWMAEVLAQDEEYVSAMTGCLEDRGQIVLSHAGKIATQTPTDERGEEIPGAAELADRAYDECAALVPEQTYFSDDREVEHGRMLDVLECLEHAGYELPEPPSREAWVSGDAEYSPFGILVADDGPYAGAVEVDEVLELIERCPPSSQKLILLDPGKAG